ncbi:hypothetical protein D3C71_1929520 [compost metagenome]
MDDPLLQRKLWDTIKDGGTVKALREAKRAQMGGGEPDSVAAAKVQPAPAVRFVSAVQRIAKDFSAVDAGELRAHRKQLSEAQWQELRRLHALLDELLA